MTPEAKFVTILANIYEVVFLVIMFNILVARPVNNDGNGSEKAQKGSVEEYSPKEEPSKEDPSKKIVLSRR